MQIHIASSGQTNVCRQRGCGGQDVGRSYGIALAPDVGQGHSLIRLTNFLRVDHLYNTGVRVQQGPIQSQLKKAAVGIGTVHCSLHSPVVIDLIISCFFSKVSLAKQLSCQHSTLATQELSIHIDLANIVKIQGCHVLTWSESNQAVAQQIIVYFNIGSVDVVAVGQLIGFVGQVWQQAQFNLSVVTLCPVIEVECGTGLHNLQCAPVHVFVLDNFTFAVGS